MKHSFIKIGVRNLAIVTFAASLTACETAAMLVLNSTEQTSITVEGDKLFIMGLLNSKTFGQMQKTITANPQIDTLVFTAMPGSIDDEVTFEMGRWLRAKKLNTHLTAKTVIASGAVDLFLSGSQRTMEAGAQLGVHSWSDGSKEAADYPRDSEEHALNLNYIIDMDVPADFYWFTIYEAPADAIHWMSTDEVLKYGLLTTPIKSTDTSGGIPFNNFEEMRLEILED